MDVAAAILGTAEHLNLAPLSLVVRPLSGNGSAVEIEAALPLYPASMIKTPLAAAVYALAHLGALALTDRVSVTRANLTTNDVESPLEPGYQATVGQLVDLMIARSDNVATNMLLDVAGRNRATELVRKEFGLSSTAFHRKLSGALPLIDDPHWDGVHRNAHPACDAARLFEAIARDAIPGAHALFQTLSRQVWNEKLSTGLRSGDRFAHKTGDTDEVTHDGGILEIQQGAGYVLVVYTGMASTPENNAKFGPFMARLRTFLR